MNALMEFKAQMERARLHQLKAVSAGHAAVAEQFSIRRRKWFLA
jgi:hypothetical protein